MVRSTVVKPQTVFVLVLVFVFSFLAEDPAHPASSNPEFLYQKARHGFHELMGSRKKQAYRHYWMKVIHRFLSIYENYPQSDQAYKAVFTVGRLYHKLYRVTRSSSDLDRAIHFYNQVVTEFEAGRLTDDALCYQGELLVEKEDYPAALGAFRRVTREYPQGDQVRRAREQARQIAPRVKSLKTERPEDSPVILKKVSYLHTPNSTRVVAYTSGPAEVSQNRLSDPERVYFNFRNSRLGENFDKKIEVDGELVQRLRASQFDPETSRLVLDLQSQKKLKIVTRQEESRVIIDLLKPGGPPRAPEKRVAKKPEKTGSTVARASPVKKTPSKKPLIVIDAGHGGKDFGAVGSHGLYEKEINLDICNRLKRILEKDYHYRVVLTRTDDTFISLKERGEIANRVEGDLFVSVHVNAAKRRSAHGIETYYLGIGHSDQARETAARENGDLVHSVSDDQVQQILASLISTTKINDSAQLASHIQTRLYTSMKGKYKGVKDLGVKEGPFFVLHDTNMPSVLVEVGFITNSREERRLKNSNYLESLASSIARGIKDFLKDRGPTI